MHPYLDVRSPVAIAHRGGGGAAAENTMAAFADAVDLGYRYLETDVHATRDGVVVAFHDPDLARVSGRAGRIAELRWDEVKAITIGDDDRIPRLDDILDTWPEARVNVDPKSDAVVEPLARLLTSGDRLDRVCVGSFADERLAELRARFGERLCTSAGPREVRRLRMSSYLGVLGRVVPVGCDCVQVPVAHQGRIIVDTRMVDHLHGRGIPLHVWTINEPAEMHRLLDLGVDAIMTDETRVLREVLVERGEWHA